MRKALLVLLAAASLTLFNVGAAEARLFEPQADWLHAGRLCVSTRGSPSRRAEALPPRACRVAERAPVRRVSVAAFRDDGVCKRKQIAEPEAQLA